MKQTLAVGTWMLLTLPFAQPVHAQDLVVKSLTPVKSALEVPINTGLRIEFELPPNLIDDGLPELPVLQGADGTLRAPTWHVGLSLSETLVLFSEPLALDPHAHYELKSRVQQCEGDKTRLCTSPTYKSISSFDTSDTADTTAPSARLLSQKGHDECLVMLTLAGSDDHTPDAAMVYTSDDIDDDLSPSGNQVLVYPMYQEKSSITVTPVDLSGNRGAPVRVELPGCDAAPDVDHVIHPKDSGCSVRDMRTSSSGTPLALVSLLAGLLVALRRRRKQR